MRVHTKTLKLAQCFTISLTPIILVINDFRFSFLIIYIAFYLQSAMENVNFLSGYSWLRSRLTEEAGGEEVAAQLQRCHLPTGKVSQLLENLE